MTLIHWGKGIKGDFGIQWNKQFVWIIFGKRDYFRLWGGRS
jgi:hypothetical protein